MPPHSVALAGRIPRRSGTAELHPAHTSGYRYLRQESKSVKVLSRLAEHSSQSRAAASPDTALRSATPMLKRSLARSSTCTLYVRVLGALKDFSAGVTRQ